MSRKFFAAVCACATAIASSSPVTAGELTTPSGTIDLSTVTRVEEDWIAYISNPDYQIGAPQIVNLISPTQTTDQTFGMIELNHQSQPTFSGGSVQVQTWVGDQYNSLAFSESLGKLSMKYDKLTYTVGMEHVGDAINVFVRNGRSKTWGKFAETEISADMPSEGITFADYDPQFSVDNSTVNVGAHRVVLMYQQATRYYTADGLVHTDDTDRVIHRFKELIQFVSLEEYEANLSQYNIDITE